MAEDIFERIRREIQRGLDELERDVHRLLRSFGVPMRMAPPLVRERVEEFAEYFRPYFDLREEDGKYIVYVELPGVPKEAVETRVAQDSLEIKADLPEELRAVKGFKGYRCRIGLPSPVEPESSKATFRNGILTITLKRKEARPPGFKIPIE